MWLTTPVPWNNSIARPKWAATRRLNIRAAIVGLVQEAVTHVIGFASISSRVSLVGLFRRCLRPHWGISIAKVVLV